MEKPLSVCSLYLHVNVSISILITCISIITGEVWPGPCVFPEFTQEKARSWWANLVKDFISNGVDGMWHDMNEPVVFEVKSTSFP